MSELRILKSEWFKLKDVIQSVINNTPIRDVGKTPIEIVFGKRDTSVLDYLGNNKAEVVSELDIDQWKTEHIKLIAEFKKDLDDIHESISIGNNREELEQNIHKLTIGDFVVYGEPIGKKTEFAWKGPYQVVNLDSPHIITLREAGIANDMEDIKAHISRVRYLHDKNLEYNISWNEQSLWLDDEYILANIDSIYKKGQDYFTRTKWNTTDGKRYLYRDIKLDDFQRVYPREILKYLQLHLEDDIIRDLLDGWDMPDLQVI